MWQPKQNNPAGLDSLTTLPGETPVDKNAAWQKLELRLHKKPRSVNAAWYWAAAAAAILVFALSLNFAAHNTPSVAHQLQAPAPHPGTVFPEKKNEITTAILPPGKKVENNIISFSVKSRNFKPVLKTSVPNPVAKINLPGFEKLPAFDSPVTTDSSSLVSVPPVKKKLKVVNTNELDDADRFASKSLPKRGADYTDSKKAAKKEYAGAFNFRIYLKN